MDMYHLRISHTSCLTMMRKITMRSSICKLMKLICTWWMMT